MLPAVKQLGLLVLLLLVGVLVWFLLPPAASERPDLGTVDGGVDEPSEEPPAELDEPLGEASMAPWEWGKRPSPEQAREWRERMRRMREEWMALSPEERQRRMAERAERMVTIRSLDGTPADLEPVDLMGPIREVGGAIHQCVEGKGGWREFWAAARRAAPDAGPGGRRAPTVSFEVDPEGSLDPDTLVLDPPPPEGYAECFTEAWTTAEVPRPNTEVHVEVRFGPPPGARPPFGGRPGERPRSPNP